MSKAAIEIYFHAQTQDNHISNGGKILGLLECGKTTKITPGHLRKPQDPKPYKMRADDQLKVQSFSSSPILFYYSLIFIYPLFSQFSFEFGR